MTTEYLRGEVLQLLDWARQQGPRCRAADQALGELRQDAQSVPVDDLSWVVESALTVVEAWCGDALAADDADALRVRCRLAAALYDFGICSNLLPSTSGDSPSVCTAMRRKGYGP